jgi:hypothetical protein
MPPKKKSGKTRKAKPAARKKSSTRAAKPKAGAKERKLRAAAGAYWRTMIDAGYLRGPAGNMTLDDGVLMLTEAIYQLLAGGTVTGTVPGTLTVTPGIDTRVNEFNRLGANYLDAINEAGGPVKLKMMTS